ncbi:MAG TPA: cbb3-type cytochrome c oxidase subunit II [Methylomirabilota bacterium]|nr:cbb3-type cytochrome c oxidase subunit II [Methylomirabilota bacterium]
MNRLPLLFVGILLVFSTSWIGLVAYPYLNLGHLAPGTSSDGLVPPPMTASAIAGERVYAANGCIYCHSQQVRPAWLSTDIQKGLGPRQTVARDYIRQSPTFLGTMRSGPDLSNIALRQPLPGWHYQHLYEPDMVTAGSIMPSFRFLFRVQPIQGQPSLEAVTVRGPHAPPPGYEVVPTQDARDLVAYLLSLKHDYPLPEVPEPPKAKK